MKTYFAPAERASNDALQDHVAQVTSNSIIDALMSLSTGLLAVLNEHRQILALNDSFLKLLGIDDVEGVLGLRPGEAIACIHADEQEGGCGTSEYCSTCGAAIAIVTALGSHITARKTCAVTVTKNDKQEDLYLEVCAQPASFGRHRLVLLFARDITDQQRRAMLERVFFHDVSNLVMGIVGESAMLLSENGEDAREIARDLVDASSRLAKEIQLQRYLANSGDAILRAQPQECTVEEVLAEVTKTFKHHPLAEGKTVVPPESPPNVTVNTDLLLVVRVLTNMVTNALEASEAGDEVRLTVTAIPDRITFSVWNRGPIPPDTGRRVFQRNFSTKDGSGRGLGTYSMKLIGEEVLGGRVDFTSSESDGTVFRFSLPL